MSPKRRVEAKIYLEMKLKFMEELPICEVCMKAKSTDIHHVAGRGKHYLDEKTWMSVCRTCHDKIHKEPIWARENNYLQ